MTHRKIGEDVHRPDGRIPARAVDGPRGDPIVVILQGGRAGAWACEGHLTSSNSLNKQVK